MGALRYDEPFPYHPHVTLAQYLESDQLDELSRVARDRWRSCTLDRHFRVDTITFVQNTRRNLWIDLAEFRLGAD
jgi:2'-5' RNA ligase